MRNMLLAVFAVFAVNSSTGVLAFAEKLPLWARIGFVMLGGLGSGFALALKIDLKKEDK